MAGQAVTSLTERVSREVRLPEEDLDYLQRRDEIDVERTGGETATLESKRSVGVLGLPSGGTLEIGPKSDCNLLYLLAYTGRLDDDVATGDVTGIETGGSIVYIVARLFEQEVREILQRGLHSRYQTRQTSEEYLHGRLDVQRQLQSAGPAATRFECEYDELTAQTPANVVLLNTTELLLSLVDHAELQGDLRRLRGRLRQQVDPEPVSEDTLDAVEITRLNDYYEPAMRLARLVLRESFVSDLRAGDTRIESFLLNVEALFETLVLEAASAVVDPAEYSVDADRVGFLVEGEDAGRTLGLYPDVVVRDARSGRVDLVGDAKWKATASPARSDLYQIASYQAKFGVPGVLFYPGQDGALADRFDYQVDTGSEPQGELQTVELPLTANSYRAFVSRIERRVRAAITGRLR